MLDACSNNQSRRPEHKSRQVGSAETCPAPLIARDSCKIGLPDIPRIMHLRSRGHKSGCPLARQRESEGRAVALGAFDSYFAAVRFNKCLDDCQTQADAGLVVRVG